MKYRLLSLLFILILFPFHLSSLEVGGHLTEDTIWSPENNPYLVTETLYVDEGVTLSILPGTEIKVSGASLASGYEYTQNFWIHNGVSIAKYIQIDGRIIAEGTQQDSIVFTRMQDDMNYNWGSMYITDDAELCVFKHCVFEHMGNIGLAVSNISEGLDLCNGKGSIKNCKFLNCTIGINSDSYEKELEIIENEFIINDGVNPYLPSFNYGKNFIMSSRIGTFEAKDVLICNNVFEGYGSYHGFSVEQMSFAFNTLLECIGSGGANYFYDNDFINSTIVGYNYDSLYIKNNSFIDGGVSLNIAYVEISDNNFEGCGIAGPSEIELIGIVKNNIISNTGIAVSGRFDKIYNNSFYDCNMVSSVIGSSNIFSNNLMCNNTELCNLIADTPTIENNIFINNNIDDIDIFGTPVFRNCIIDFPIEYPLIDGGGNIIVDSLQAQSIFVDIQNGDFHLAEGSIAIDAGFDTLGYYYPFDMDYNHRVWDGDNNGTAIIDIGPYEFGAPSFGGIQGMTYNPVNGEPVDYVLIKINNQPGEFTFSDSVGSYQYKLPANVYDIYAERVFYDDVIEYQIEVIDGEFTQLDIAMYETVKVNEYEVPPNSSLISHLSNYPNPFNPSTTIRFETTNLHELPRIEIYNLKGQKVKVFTFPNGSLGTSEQNLQIIQSPNHQIVWDGTDQTGKPVSSGIYFVRVKAGEMEASRKMLLLK
ncbi:MAG: T9SS type A sorting domain-containing protein [Candidatus Cloacimonadales bacterium]|nr:T9SS type A sorting domain-containing protein [Candidatus Cloacimonadales bacterium]